ncbi:MAG: tRNA 2-thiocytidine biosynthesis TtcA family protein [Lachnospirales bacterium]
MTYQRLLSYTRKAVDDYQMIQEGDRIAVGISGGKDSITLALALKGLQRFYPKHFEVMAFTVALGFPDFDTEPLAALMRSYEIPYHVISTDIGPIVFEERKESNPCSLCAKMRKGAFNDFALQMHCNKVALGHHKEDVIETFFMSLFYEGRLHTFSPVTYWDRTKLYAIRPLLYTPEADIIAFAQNMNLPIIKNPCPADGITKRGEFKERLRDWNKEIGHTTERVFRAIQDSIPGWQVQKGEKP